MCGRYTLTSFDTLIEEFGLIQTSLDLTPRYNIAPSTPVPVVGNRGERRLELMRWGLVPHWAKDPAIGNRMINARSETAAKKPAFREALRRRRCLVVADGFYEWKRDGKHKTPFYIRRLSHGPIAFAGLWEYWQNADGTPLHTCTILTTEPNDLMAPIHKRMPVIVERADYDRWLEPSPLPPPVLHDILGTPSSDGFEAYPVSRLVNSPKNDSPECIVPAAVSTPPPPVQGSLF